MLRQIDSLVSGHARRAGKFRARPRLGGPEISTSQFGWLTGQWMRPFAGEFTSFCVTFTNLLSYVFELRNRGRESGMLTSEKLAILRFLEDTRGPGLSMLGIEARDPIWMMSIALLRRHYLNQRITISSLAESSGAAYTTALRCIDRMVDLGLLVRRKSRAQPKLVFIEPTDALLRNFHDYCILIKNQLGSAFGLGDRDSAGFVFGAAHFAARIIPPPSKLYPPLCLD